MVRKLAGVLSAAVVCMAGIGCATGDWQRRYDALSLENEDLMRQKALVESDLLACQARCDSLDRNSRSAVPPSSGVTPIPFPVPGKIEGIDIRRRGNETVINMPSDVFFSSGSSTLNRSGQRTMGRIVDYIRTNHPNGLLRIEGHSDTDPIRQTRGKYHCNWELSFERAHSVMHFLVSKGGFDPRRVVCESYGEYHPKDQRVKSKNCRGETVIAQ